jgi:hypothetical protein
MKRYAIVRNDVVLVFVPARCAGTLFVIYALRN